MRKDDLVFTGHMLDTAEKSVAKLTGKSRADIVEYDGEPRIKIDREILLRKA